MDAADLLERTADVIEERGHAKRILQDPLTGAVCLVGGVHVAAGGTAYGSGVDPELRPTVERVFEALGAYLNLPEDEGCELGCCPPSPQVAAVAWNNADEREPHEVIDACRHAAKVLRGG